MPGWEQGSAGLRGAPGHAGQQSCGVSSDLQPRWGCFASTAPASSAPGLRPLICGVRGERKEANALVVIAKALGYSCRSSLHGPLTGAGCGQHVLGAPCPSPATLPTAPHCAGRQVSPDPKPASCLGEHFRSRVETRAARWPLRYPPRVSAKSCRASSVPALQPDLPPATRHLQPLPLRPGCSQGSSV